MMDEIIALEDTIREALPSASDAAEHDAGLRPVVACAHDILCNSWNGPGLRIASLRNIARDLARFAA